MHTPASAHVDPWGTPSLAPGVVEFDAGAAGALAMLWSTVGPAHSCCWLPMVLNLLRLQLLLSQKSRQGLVADLQKLLESRLHPRVRQAVHLDKGG